jgi:hypothetical protein
MKSPNSFASDEFCESSQSVHNIKLSMTKARRDSSHLLNLWWNYYNLLAIVCLGGLGGLTTLPFGLPIKIFVFSVFFSPLPSFLFIYVVRAIGPVKASWVDFGQIIGVISGVFILDEWSNHQ